MNQTVSEAKEKFKEERKKNEKEKDYEKKGTTCRNSCITAIYWLTIGTAVLSVAVVLQAVVEVLLVV